MNPRAGSRHQIEQVQAIEAAVTMAGFHPTLTSDLDELSRISTDGAASGRLRAVIAIGGDGTASVVRSRVPLSVPLLPVPMGTENLLGRFVAQGTDPAAVCRTVADGVVVGLDLGRANGQHFLLMISAGFDAEVVRLLHQTRRGNITRLAYLLPALRTIRSYGYPEMKLYWGDGADDDQAATLCRWLFGFNLPLYALGLPIAPEAVATDGLLDVCTFQRGNTWSVLRYLWHVKLGQHQSLSDAATVRCRRFRLEGPKTHAIAYQLDGDFAGTLPVDVEVLPGELRLLVSREVAHRLGFALPREELSGPAEYCRL
jgi:diacylglycerol kinase family enzyme